MATKAKTEDVDFEFEALNDLVDICLSFDARLDQLLGEVEDDGHQRIMQYLESRFPFIYDHTKAQ